jgi:hypothetical protein
LTTADRTLSGHRRDEIKKEAQSGAGIPHCDGPNARENVFDALARCDKEVSAK